MRKKGGIGGVLASQLLTDLTMTKYPLRKSIVNQHNNQSEKQKLKMCVAKRCEFSLSHIELKYRRFCSKHDFADCKIFLRWF